MSDTVSLGKGLTIDIPRAKSLASGIVIGLVIMIALMWKLYGTN